MASQPVSLFLVAGLLLGLAAPSSASAWQATAEDVETSLISELAGLVRAGQLHRLEAIVRPIHASLPKNEHGNLAPEEVRSALGQLFAQRPGWSLKGTRPGGEAWAVAHLQKLVEDRLDGRGVGPRELAALAASLEGLVRKEATARLEAAFRASGLALTGRSGRPQVLHALRLYAEGYLGGNASASAGAWMQRWEADQWSAEGSELSFQDAGRLVLAIERQFSRLKARECSDLAPAIREAQCLDVSSLYSLCCREGLAAAVEPSVWMAAWVELPGLCVFSAACFLLAAMVTLGGWLCGRLAPEEGGPEAADGDEAEATDDVVKPEKPAPPQQVGALGACVVLGLLCALAAALDLLDVSILALAMGAGLLLLAGAHLAPKPPKAKKC
uniref:Uncharacterized protein n=1 Tax=Alexandrium monilatum TaxID=311494 RepID=A0A7S4PX03_9DINO|mmetsp:Transcript_24656/g.78053  ORF Transcript_24656/g.78053 Transcript_24656/m.78053 type:complete len:386 (+) Transcript_24656:76-1233(+)